MVALRVSDLTYRYPDGTEALRGLTFSVEEGKRVAILGANGSGKTTLLRCLNGLLSPSSGWVEVMGERVERGSLDSVRQNLQLVFQNPDDQLFAPTVEEDISFGPRNLGLDREEVKILADEALSSLGIGDLRNRNPSQLSQGQKKLVAIAGVVAMRPTIIALDEPASDLDERSSQAILRVLDAFHGEGKTILMATHDADLAAVWADEIVLLAGGNLAVQGTPSEVFYALGDSAILGVQVPAVVYLYRRLADMGLVRPNERPTSMEELMASLRMTVKAD